MQDNCTENSVRSASEHHVFVYGEAIKEIRDMATDRVLVTSELAEGGNAGPTTGRIMSTGRLDRIWISDQTGWDLQYRVKVRRARGWLSWLSVDQERNRDQGGEQICDHDQFGVYYTRWSAISKVITITDEISKAIVINDAIEMRIND